MVEYNSKKDSYNFGKKEIDFFVNIGFQIIDKCNYKCEFCCVDPVEEDLLILNKSKKIINALAKNGLKRLSITGGEPLLYPRLVELLKHIKSKKIKITLATNGSLLSKKLFEEIRPHIDNIRFSIYGDNKIHDELSGVEGSYEKTLKGVKMASALHIPTTIVFVALKKNINALPSLVKACEANRVEKLYIFSLMNRGKARKIYKKQRVPERIIKKLIDKINADTKKNKWKLKIIYVNWGIDGQCILFYPTGDLFAVTKKKENNGNEFLGNLLKEDPKKIWEKFPYKKNYVEYHKNK
ncbi:MAG: radical SAM protein [Candidatus Diapherotrites archaeon]|nr:radical SAM protein [Candidatus Diapherotrites archaeon]